MLDSIPLTYDHKPSDPEEQDRIKKLGGDVHAKEEYVGKSGDVVVSPMRVWYRSTHVHAVKTIGLAMTRSLGDSGAHKVQ